MTGCHPSPVLPNENLDASSDILIVYFSLYGNTKGQEDVDVSTSASLVEEDGIYNGTTEYVAKYIQKQTNGDLYKIEVKEKYSQDFQSVVDRNHEEKNQNIYPDIMSSSLVMDNYDVVFIGYPIWASSVPQAVFTFIDQYDFSDQTIIPFCTHDGYGSGHSYQDIETHIQSQNILEGLDIEANQVLSSQALIDQWLESLPLTDHHDEMAIDIQIENTHLNGILYQNPMAQQFQNMLPLTISMVHYGDREFYGPIDETIEWNGEGQYDFENGDITYCPQNNTIAIFYNQSDQSHLTMEVYVIGKVTSDLSVFHHLSSRENMIWSLKS